VTGGPPNPRKVFVIHGRDEQARAALFDFLQDLDLHPIQWEELVSQTGKGSPYNGEVVARAFREATAVIVLMTPDDEARLHPELHEPHESEYELELTGQARPNVLLEAGMALQAQPDRTIFVEIGALRPASDLLGLNVVRLAGAAGSLLALAMRLETAGCAVNRSDPNWMQTARFSELSAATRRPNLPSEGNPGHLPRGTRLSAVNPAPAPPGLAARLHSRGKDYLLEVVNSGGTTLRNVTWELPPEATNWGILADVLPSYPIPQLEPREHIRVPVVLTIGGPVIIEATFTAEADGKPYSTKAMLSIYD